MAMPGLQPQLDLITWVRREEGFLHPEVEVASDSDRGYHIRVGAGHIIRANTRIASCPISTTISVLNAMNIAPFGSHGTNFPSSFINKQSFTVVQYFFLIEQYLLGSDSWWAPYISTIPNPDAIDTMIFTDDEDMRWLAGTNLKGALAKQNDKWRDLYTAASAQLKQLGWANAERCTWRLFLWAAMMFGSRGFTSQVLSDTLPADQARPAGHDHPHHQELAKLFSGGFPVLCPLLDILNYKPGAQVEWQPRFSYVGLQVLEQHKEGEEICNNYGPRDNETLMLGYGFAIASNPFDHFSVGLRVPVCSPLAQTRTWYLDKKKPEDFLCYIFNTEHPRAKSASCLEASVFSFDLLDSISVLCANDRELQAMFESKKTYINARLASKATGDNRNLLHAFAQLYRECQQRLSLLQRSDPASNGEVASTPQQRYAQIYRDSQLETLATAKVLCKYTLFRAQTQPSEDAVAMLRASSDWTNLDQIAGRNLIRLLQHHVPLTQSYELFGFAELSRLLPGRNSEVVLTLDETVPGSTPQSQRIRLALLIVVLGALAKEALPSRFRAWFRKLHEWYDGESWSTLATPDADGDSEKVQALLTKIVENIDHRTLQSLLASKRALPQKLVNVETLIRAWNVVGEESVQIPHELALGRDGNGNGNSIRNGDGAGAASLVLYVPQ